ncbi:DUF4265 domain-containing protein [Neisseria lisongii]|uniref:DUF4265 domain-containing protein n=1 Tax=Neisseria lisongii TaxID=2912188 RepID=A0AAW5AJE1_9NEIS|nr:DUF4265 domain-containing protein [Neisseria lisongii]
MLFDIYIIFYDLEGNLAEEKVSALLLNDGNYMVKDIPLFTPNLALDDIIAVETDEKLYFDKLVSSSGNSTINIVFFDEKIDIIVQKIRNMGGEIRYWNNKYISINIPANISYYPIKNFLNHLEENHCLSYREACLANNSLHEVH